MLTGCPVHHCRLQETCSHCGKTIPVFTSPFGVGQCPFCEVKLSGAALTPLEPSEIALVEQRFRDLTFLLSPYAELPPSDKRLQLIGRQLQLLRRQRNLLAQDVALLLGITQDKVGRIERARVEGSGVQLEIIVAYADLLNLSVTEIIQAAWGNPEVTASLAKKMATTRAWTEDGLVVAIEETHNKRASQGLSTSVVAILGDLSIDYHDLTNYPKAQVLMRNIAKENSEKRSRKLKAVRLPTFIDRIKYAIFDLETRGIRPTTRQIEIASGLHRDTMRFHPELRELVEAAIGHSIGELKPQNKQRIGQSGSSPKFSIREADLLAKVQEAINQLIAERKSVTQMAVSHLVGVHTSTLSYYPLVREILQLIAEGHFESKDTSLSRDSSLRKSNRNGERQQELVHQIEIYIAEAHKRGETLTQQEVATRIGLSVTGLRKYLPVRELLKQIAQTNRARQRGESSE